MNLIIIRTKEQHDFNGRVAFIAGKKLGNAVWRNKAKRRMRALCKLSGGPYPGYDVLFIAKRTVNNTHFSAIEQRLRKALSKQGIVDNL